MEEPELEDLLARVDDARGLPAAERVMVVNEVVRILELRNESSGSAGLNYALGYAWYFHPDRSQNPELVERVNGYLGAALKERPDDYLSHLYLGHNAFDLGSIREALTWFQKATRLAPASYIGLKAHEMVACCRVQLEGPKASSIQAYVEQAERLVKEDIWPEQLAHALRNAAFEHGNADRRDLLRLAERLDNAGNLSGWIAEIIRHGPEREAQ